ncbi:MAG: thioesterase family protein [Verrucomicrobiota bacterium]
MSEGVIGEIFAYPLEVSEAVIDTNGHVNNVAYVQWMQDVAIQHFSALGGDEFLRASAATWVARSHHIEYLLPVFEGEALLAKTWVSTLAGVRSTRCYEFFRDEKVVARGETEWIFVDAATGRPKRIPEALRATFGKAG